MANSVHTGVTSVVTLLLDKQSYMSGWEARLALDFASRVNQTRLIKRQHHGPLVLQKILYPEGSDTAHGLIVHPPGGVAGGDKLTLAVSLADDSHVLLTTPGATKWYKSAGRLASQSIIIDQKPNSCLEWFPQENILFDGADAELTTTVNLSGNAVFSSWEITCLGRKASGESWLTGRLRQTLNISRDNLLIWHDNAVLNPTSPIISAIAGLRECVVFGNLVIAAGKAPTEVIDACRNITVNSGALTGVSALAEIFTARYIGNCAQEARAYFEALWACLRPWYCDKKANRPRIWAT